MVNASVEIIIEKEGKIVLIKRKDYPFKGMWKLPGGMVEDGDTVEETAVKEAKEETGFDVELVDILGVYSNPKRDPRMHSLATVFITKPVNGSLTNCKEEAIDEEWFDIEKIDTRTLGFDHGKIVEDYKRWLKSKGSYWTGR